MNKKIPFAFVLEELDRVQPFVRPMFGCYAVYVGEKLVLILRDRADHANDNGVWVAALKEQHTSLKKDFPCLRSIRLFGTMETVWQNIPKEEDDFEELVLKVCALIVKGDPRIGKIPKPKKKKSKK